MSEMEFFHGYFEPSDLAIEPEDTDDFYDLEEEHKCHFVMVDGQLYRFWGSDVDTDAYGFEVAFEPEKRPQLMLYWYNGCAGIHEVAESAIRKYLNDK